MKRREALAGLGAVLAAAPLAGCAEQLEELVEETSEEASDEAAEAVNETLADLARPPNADLEEVEENTYLVTSLGADTVGVVCGPLDGENPVAAVQESEEAATAAGQLLEDCDALMLAVNEAGDVEQVEP